MAEIRIENFGGRIPKMSSRLLPANFAQTATNCKLYSGELRGWNDLNLVSELSGTVNTAYRIPDSGGDIWFASAYSNVHVQKGTLVNDSYDRYYWTSGTDDVPRYNTKARISASSPSYILGAPAPTSAPTMSAPSGGSSNLVVTRVFVYTFVSQYGEESAPSPTLTQTGQVDDTWTLGGMQVETAAPINGRDNFTSANGAKKRIYRTITSASGQTNFYFIKEVDMSIVSTDVSDTDETVAYNSLLESVGWDEPPDDLEGLITHPNGFLVGYVGTDLHFSEPYRPHAWPTSYILSTDHEIMGLGIVGNTIGVTTKSNPYGCTGTVPSAMSLTKSTTVEPCLSKKGVVTLSDGVYYPSNNGLAWLNPGGARVITTSLVSKEEWQTQFTPGSLNACRYGVRYLAFEDASVGFVFDPTESRHSIVDISRDSSVRDIFTDETTGVVYILTTANNVYEWDPSSNTQPVTYTWKSKVFEFTRPVNMGAAILKYNTDDLTTSAAYLAQLEAINTSIMATVPPSLGSFNTMGFNSTRPEVIATYKSGMDAASVQQNGTFNGSDLLDISVYSSYVPIARVAIYADGVEKTRLDVNNTDMFRLPAGYKAHVYEVEIISNTDVYSFAMAETPRGLSKV